MTDNEKRWTVTMAYTICFSLGKRSPLLAIPNASLFRDGMPFNVRLYVEICERLRRTRAGDVKTYEINLKDDGLLVTFLNDERVRQHMGVFLFEMGG